MGKKLKVVGYWSKLQICSSSRPPSISTSSVSLREKCLHQKRALFLGSLLVLAASLWERQGLRNSGWSDIGANLLTTWNFNKFCISQREVAYTRREPFFWPLFWYKQLLSERDRTCWNGGWSATGAFLYTEKRQPSSSASRTSTYEAVFRSIDSSAGVLTAILLQNHDWWYLRSEK